MSEALWTVADFVAGVAGELVGAAPAGVTGISIDSRTLAPGEAFFAIVGDRFDGHGFAAAALESGAALAVVAADRVGEIAARPLVVVDDPFQALERLGVAARARATGKVIAVTGSVGKTSTKEMLKLALSQSGETHVSAASFNNHWGVPLSLARMPANAAFAVLEIGMNHTGEITPLVAMVRPHVAVITTVEPVHLEHFSGIEEIADAKAEIFTGLVPGGVAILNADNPLLDRLLERAGEAGVERIVRFGRAETADARMLKFAPSDTCSCISADILGSDVAYKIGAPGMHLAMNSLAVLAACQLAGADLAKAALGLADFSAQKGRGERLQLVMRDGEITVIDESYNANPASMRAAIELLAVARTGRGGRRIAVLGDMLELGEDSEKLHRELAGPLETATADRIYLAGPMMKALWDVLPPHRRGAYSKRSAGLESILPGELVPGDVVMIKGSFGSRMGILVDALKARYGSA